MTNIDKKSVVPAIAPIDLANLYSLVAFTDNEQPLSPFLEIEQVMQPIVSEHVDNILFYK